MKFNRLLEATQYKKKLSQLLDDNLVQLNSLYTRNGHKLRIVGGAVRDILLGKTPKDIDLATDATPEESIEILQSDNIKVIETGLQHGTVTAHMDGEDYEITTLRIDQETDGRHAKVEYTRDWEQDAERRDLTFNAMSLDFDGNLYDYHGGQQDLELNQAKFVGSADKRIQEDYLRILRYFRFQGRMENPNFNSKTLESIKNNAEGLDRISGERIWSEMEKILSGDHALSILKKMKETNVLNYTGLSGINFKEFKQVKNVTSEPVLLLASLLDSVEELDTLRNRWKFSNPEYATMKFVIQNRDKKLSLKSIKRMHVMKRTNRTLINDLLRYLGKRDLLNNFDNWNPPDFPITGEDLKNIGISPGPEMGKILNQLKDRWVSSGFQLNKDNLLKNV